MLAALCIYGSEKPLEEELKRICVVRSERGGENVSDGNCPITPSKAPLNTLEIDRRGNMSASDQTLVLWFSSASYDGVTGEIMEMSTGARPKTRVIALTDGEATQRSEMHGPFSQICP